MKYLILINIGPVQDFIASARRSRDLWFGSWLLSELSKTAAAKIVEFYKRESLIFPAILDPSDLDENSPFNAANKIVAIVEKPTEVAEAIFEAIQKKLTAIREKAFREFETKIELDLAMRQVEELIEFSWAAVEFENESEYEKAREKVEYLAAARKNTREFNQTDLTEKQGEYRKSALDGKRESVIADQEYKKDAAYLHKTYKIREKERLCGIGLLKRHGNKDAENKVISTSHVAALPFLQSIENTTNNKEEVRRFKEKLTAIGIDRSDLHSLSNEFAAQKIFGDSDGHLLFAERMRDYFDKPENIEKAQLAVKTLFDDIKRKQSELSPYYALLLADGDNMGKVIDACKTPDEHRKISTALSEFAQNVIENFNKIYGGSLIYAGGDDVLALVPIHEVLDCAKDLAGKFADKLEDFKSKDGIVPTLSVGIAVAHHLEPLSDALELARKAEKTAKKVDGKNGLAIIVDKRSGTSREISGKLNEIYERLQQLIKLHNNGEVSHQLGYELRDLSNRLEVDQKHLDDNQKSVLGKIKEVETIRIIDRKLSEMGKSKLSKAEKNEKFGAIYKLAEKENGAKLVAEELITSMIFADAIKQSKGHKTNE